MGPGFSEVQGPPRGEWWCPVKDTECTEMAGGLTPAALPAGFLSNMHGVG